MRNYIFTSEAVSEGHPDKVCDQISDAILDLFLSKDPYSRVACETLATTNVVKIAGEVRCAKKVSNEEIEKVVRDTIKEIGYEQEGFSWKDVKIENLLHSQSIDIAVGVDETKNKEEGAGDQGIMFGYACDETKEFMPSAIYYSNRLLEKILTDIKQGKLKDLGPEPFSLEFNANYLFEKIKKRRLPIKQLLMDNKVVVGVGNIYASEVLFATSISPLRKGCEITHSECEALVSAIVAILKASIEKGGTTIRDFSGADGKPGYFVQNLHVYGHKGEPCPRCGTAIEEVTLGQRSSFYCPNCQK